MAKTGTLRDLSNKVPTPEQFSQIDEEVATASDRHFAILAGTEAENVLRQAIILSLPRRDKDTIKKLTDERGPMNTFSQKIDLAYALSLYDKQTQADLHKIREMRNAFAHILIPIDFNTPQVASKVRALKSGQTDLPAGTTLRDRFRYAYRASLNVLLHISISRQTMILRVGNDSVLGVSQSTSG